MKVIVVGCGRFGAELAYRLFQSGHEVTVVDYSPASFAVLPSDFGGRLVDGEATSQDVLVRAGIETADALAVVTNSDALNLVVGRIAREVYHVPNVVARNYDPHAADLYELFGLQVVSAASWGAQRMEEILGQSSLRRVFSAGQGEVAVYEVTIPEAWHGKPLKQLVNSFCSVVAITRGGKARIPQPDQMLEAGDLLSISATAEGAMQLQKRLTGSSEEGN